MGLGRRQSSGLALALLPLLCLGGWQEESAISAPVLAASTGDVCLQAQPGFHQSDTCANSKTMCDDEHWCQFLSKCCPGTCEKDELLRCPSVDTAEPSGPTPSPEGAKDAGEGDACLQSQPGWRHFETCANSKIYCDDEYWCHHMLKCCPGACAPGSCTSDPAAPTSEPAAKPTESPTEKSKDKRPAVKKGGGKVGGGKVGGGKVGGGGVKPTNSKTDDMCLRSRVGWQPEDTCATAAGWCEDEYWRLDLDACCPGLCTEATDKTGNTTMHSMVK